MNSFSKFKNSVLQFYQSRFFFLMAGVLTLIVTIINSINFFMYRAPYYQLLKNFFQDNPQFTNNYKIFYPSFLITLFLGIITILLLILTLIRLINQRKLLSTLSLSLCLFVIFIILTLWTLKDISHIARTHSQLSACLISTSESAAQPLTQNCQSLIESYSLKDLSTLLSSLVAKHVFKLYGLFIITTSSGLMTCFYLWMASNNKYLLFRKKNGGLQA